MQYNEKQNSFSAERERSFFSKHEVILGRKSPYCNYFSLTKLHPIQGPRYNEPLVAKERNEQGLNFQQCVFIKIRNIYVVV